jgi:hypothetical protein
MGLAFACLTPARCPCVYVCAWLTFQLLVHVSLAFHLVSAIAAMVVAVVLSVWWFGGLVVWWFGIRDAAVLCIRCVVGAKHRRRDTDVASLWIRTKLVHGLRSNADSTAVAGPPTSPRSERRKVGGGGTADVSDGGGGGSSTTSEKPVPAPMERTKTAPPEGPVKPRQLRCCARMKIFSFSEYWSKSG